MQQIAICYRHPFQTSAMTSGEVVRNIDEILYTLRKHQFSVINQWRRIIIVFRKIECHICHQNNFYIEIQINVESEFLAALSEKFVCPKCKGIKCKGAKK